MIDFRNVHKSFGDLTVLNGISVTFRKGETTVILGKSGTGKSVLIKHIVRLLDPDAGSVLVDGTDLAGLSDTGLQDFRKTTGFLFQSAALYDSLSVYENIAFPMRRHLLLNEDEIRSRVVESLKWVSLEGAIDKMPSELSGGMRKRVGLARSLILNPSIMLYDEPTTGLDPITSSEIAELIKTLQHRFGTTGLVVTHDMPCAFRVADRAILLADGQLVFDGDIQNLPVSDHPLVKNFYETSLAKR